MKGFINLIKPSGMSSAYAVGAVKKKFNTPCGHMGTLDPMASGVLPVGVGKSSRLFQYLLDKEKVYVARFKFGYTTDTLDVTGQETSRTNLIPTIEEINKVLPSFVGEIDQVHLTILLSVLTEKGVINLLAVALSFSYPLKKLLFWAQNV